MPDWRYWSREQALEYFITTVPNASWQTLAGGLYYLQEQAALERAKKYFQRQPGMGGCGLRSIEKHSNELLHIHQVLDMHPVHPA